MGFRCLLLSFLSQHWAEQVTPAARQAPRANWAENGTKTSLNSVLTHTTSLRDLFTLHQLYSKSDWQWPACFRSEEPKSYITKEIVLYCVTWVSAISKAQKPNTLRVTHKDSEGIWELMNMGRNFLTTHAQRKRFQKTEGLMEWKIKMLVLECTALNTFFFLTVWKLQAQSRHWIDLHFIRFWFPAFKNKRCLDSIISLKYAHTHSIDSTFAFTEREILICFPEKNKNTA